MEEADIKICQEKKTKIKRIQKIFFVRLKRLYLGFNKIVFNDKNLIVHASRALVGFYCY